MRISMLHLVVCAAALCGGVSAARADDNADQAAARAALEAKMRELNTEPVTNNAAPAPARPAQQAPSVAPATSPAQNPPPAVPEKKEQPAPVTTTAPSQPNEQPANPPAAPVSRPVQKTEHASTASNTNGGWFEPVPPPSGSKHVITESPPTTEPREENPQPAKTVQTPTPTRPTPQPAPVKQPVYTEHHGNPNAPYPGQRLGLKPIQAPGLPITQAQQDELQALLEKYEANAITPEQYQTERARILRER